MDVGKNFNERDYDRVSLETYDDAVEMARIYNKLPEGLNQDGEQGTRFRQGFLISVRLKFPNYPLDKLIYEMERLFPKDIEYWKNKDSGIVKRH